MIYKKIMFIFILFFVLFISNCNSESTKIRNIKLPEVDISKIQNGKHIGEFIHHKTNYKVEVTVDNHKITGIKVLSSEEDKYDIQALAVLDRVIEKQDLNVDSVTGATKSSKLYLICIYNALTGEKIILK